MFFFRSNKPKIQSPQKLVKIPSDSNFVLTDENKNNNYMIYMKCCNKSLDITYTYNIQLCPNCNNKLPFFIEDLENPKSKSVSESVSENVSENVSVSNINQENDRSSKEEKSITYTDNEAEINDIIANMIHDIYLEQDIMSKIKLFIRENSKILLQASIVTVSISVYMVRLLQACTELCHEIQ